MCKCTPAIKTLWCGRPGCETSSQIKQSPSTSIEVITGLKEKAELSIEKQVFIDNVKGHISSILRIMNLFKSHRLDDANELLVLTEKMIIKGISANE